MANGPSLPSTEQTIENLRLEGHTTRVDLERVRRVSEHLRKVAEQEGHPIGVPNEYNVFPYHHQLPGGMTGTLKAQLAQYNMSERFEEVLEEIVRVREDLGHPISATPFSQLMGIQSVLNVVTGERYGTVPDEVLVYVLGHLGTPPAPINPDVLDRMLCTPRGKEIQHWAPPQPTIGELKEQYGDRSMTDEELLRRYLVPLPDVEATHAAGPAPRDYHFEADGVPTSLVLDLLATSRATFAQIETAAATVTLRR
jgi:oxaloacetate decarboxylase alpha subunit